MPLRFDDTSKRLDLSVSDLVGAGAPMGNLGVQTVFSPAARMAAGRDVHASFQEARAAEDAAFRAEVGLQRRLEVHGWAIAVHGRVDGLSEEGGRLVVEEVKSTVWDAVRLFATGLAHWPSYAAQLEVYLWMVQRPDLPEPVGRLVLVSLADGARHVLGFAPDLSRIDGQIRRILTELVVARERRLAWYASRRRATVPSPFSAWRPQQADMADRVEHALERGLRLLVEAPTGYGKTAAILHGAIRHAFAHDAQIFWSTARNTQQRAVQETVERFRSAGLPLSAVTLSSRDRACVLGVPDCRPEGCPFAEGYRDRVRDRDLVRAARLLPAAEPDALGALARANTVCPHALALDTAPECDVVIGDYNYALDPAVLLRRLFSEEPERWVLVADEAHQLPERTRSWHSPRVFAAQALRAAEAIEARCDAEAARVFSSLARDVAEAVEDGLTLATGPASGTVSVAELSVAQWRDLADRVDEVALDWLHLAPSPAQEDADAWLECARSVLRFARALETASESTVHLVGREDGDAFSGLLCLDPSFWLGPRIAALGGFVACSATLSPSAFYRDLFGIPDEDVEVARFPSFFPPENRRIVVAPRVSTAYADRPAHAARTAELLQRCFEEIPGHTVVYFPSFEMLRDISRRWTSTVRPVAAQVPGMSDADRRAFLDRLRPGDPPVVLAAVLGGIFAEGIDLVAGALSGVLVVGPAFPPVGLERDLLRGCYEERFGKGFLYASIVPGVTRAVQAAGRLLRREEDRGVIVLVGRRFLWRDVRPLLPAEWDLDVAEDPVAAIAGFWRNG